jgi:hypothetical protein
MTAQQGRAGVERASTPHRQVSFITGACAAPAPRPEPRGAAVGRILPVRHRAGVIAAPISNMSPAKAPSEAPPAPVVVLGAVTWT